jgi:hypothetical protein
MRYLFFIIAFCYVLLINAQETGVSTRNPLFSPSSKTNFELGNTVVSLARYGADMERPYILLSLHNNEQTAVRQSRDFIVYNGGMFYELINNNQRNLSFNFGNKLYHFDPNRIFTLKGRTQALRQNKSHVKSAQVKLLSFARFVLKEFPKDKVIAAVHNNTDRGYSISSYKRGAILELHADRLYINPAMDEDDFFLTTSKELFEKLKTEDCNVILQSKKVKDDGSLSVYCAKVARPYINLETQHGHSAELQNMLKTLDRIFMSGND